MEPYYIISIYKLISIWLTILFFITIRSQITSGIIILRIQSRLKVFLQYLLKYSSYERKRTISLPTRREFMTLHPQDAFACIYYFDKDYFPGYQSTCVLGDKIRFARHVALCVCTRIIFMPYLCGICSPCLCALVNCTCPFTIEPV